jgi:RNA polymerase sigma-70 factor (ECF subfamily)
MLRAHGRATIGRVDDVTRWAVAARDGDQAAFTAFVRATQADVWRLCRHLGDPDSVEDLTQETYLRAVRAIGSFRADASAKTWLLSIARHTCADAIRRSRRRRRALELRSIEAYDVELPASGKVELDMLIGSLEPDRREAFVLTQILGLSYDEAAEVCRCPVGTIRSRVSRARADLVGLMAAPQSGHTAAG